MSPAEIAQKAGLDAQAARPNCACEPEGDKADFGRAVSRPKADPLLIRKQDRRDQCSAKHKPEIPNASFAHAR